MEKRITNIEVPSNRRRVLNLPELIGVDLETVTVTANGNPQQISATEDKGRFAIDFLTVQPGNLVDIIIFHAASTSCELSVIENDILSISIPDLTALRVLPLIADRKFLSYTGSQFGLFLAILLATGITSSELIQAFNTYGLKMFRIRFFEKRNSFAALDDFCRKLIPNIDELVIGDLEADIFVPVVNASSGKEGFIAKSTTPDFPILSAIKCAVANLLDYMPLRIDGEDTDNDTFSGPGLIWGFSTFSFNCPDLTLYRYLKNKNLSFTTFASYPALSFKKPKEIKNHKNVASHFQVDEIGKRIYLEEVTSVMPELVANYYFTLLDPMPVLNYADQKQIHFLLNGG